MTYQERLEAAQSKMDTLKAKMADIAEKAKAAHAMRKEDISAAINAINDDIDVLDAVIADDLAEFDEAVNVDLDELDAAVSTQVDDDIATVKGDIAAAKENARLAKERRTSKINAFKLKAQMKAENVKAKIDGVRTARDKAAQEMYILDLIDYAESCEQVAFAAAIEADLALLEAYELAADYVEKYGEPEISEAPVAESAE